MMLFPGSMGESNTLGGGRNRNPPNYTILENGVFENFILTVNHLQKHYKSLKLVYQLIIIYVRK